jgi:hypothetical protein
MAKGRNRARITKRCGHEIAEFVLYGVSARE